MKENLKKLLKKSFSIPKASALDRIRKSFSPAEKLLFILLSILLIAGAGILIMKVNRLFLVEVPGHGGRLVEGITGSPRFINPLLALSDADRDLSALIYSGLLKATPEGKLIPDLADSYSVSDNGLVYTFHVRNDARFHDGSPVTSDDVIFTIQKAQDPALKSPKRPNWEGVVAEKLNDHDLRLTLKQPYAPFLENMTTGILPKHIWKDADAEQFAFSPYNIDAVGSGPYKISKIKRNSSGIPIYFELSSFAKYTLGAPYIQNLTFRFYPTEKELIAALKRSEIESASGLTPKGASGIHADGSLIARTPLPRVFAVFFNQNQAQVLAEESVREALDLATDKKALVENVLQGFGVPIDAPVPPSLEGGGASDESPMADRIAKANKLLDAAKWKRNPETGIRERKHGKEMQRLTFSLSTSNVPELQQTAEKIAEMWRVVGVDAHVQIFEGGDLNQNVIRPRKYDALLFGEIIGRDLDLFAFWHSSQRNDPGLNVAMYTNSKVDKLLEEVRRSGDPKTRADDYEKLLAEIKRDQPAVFLYSPEFIYVIPKSVKGFELKRLTIPSERFLSVYKWYINTEHVWSIFSKD